MKFVNVVIENKTRHTDALYTYKAPDDIKVGDVIRVSFAKSKKLFRGYVFSEVEEPAYDISKIKEISEKDETVSLTEEIVSTCIWMKHRYGIKYIDAIRCFVPPGKPTKEGKEKRPTKDAGVDEQIIEELTDEQKYVVGEIEKAIDIGAQKNFLIHGVTGSGKTEVYMQAIERVLKQGRTVIMLVPEIALTKQITERFIGRFGRDVVAILHSRLTQRERFDEWSRIRTGEARIVIGARMAVFAPFSDIGLIIMDEEHEATYKADMNPKYETVDVAMKRAMAHKGILIIGSATPSVVSYQRAKDGLFELLELKKRYNETELPDIKIADMRDELRHGNATMFSELLRSEMEETLKNGEQIILFLNRRGYSSVVTCKDCGETLTCRNCGITLTYHKKENAAICHYCGRKFPIGKCEKCGSEMMRYIGVGTEQVEEFTKKVFPDRAVARLDLDTARNAKEISNILTDFASGKTDILIGTQLVAKGLDFRNVGLVGVVSADGSLHIPDYRSAERTFQLITQVAGRAGRGDKKGKVVVQTYSPDNYAITAAARYDYDGFFKQEISFRKMMKYPPYTDLILVEFTHEKENVAIKGADDFRAYISQLAKKRNDELFEPRLQSHFKGQDGNSFRYYVLIKSAKGNRSAYLAATSSYIERKLAEKGASIIVDVNPYGAL
ncbi:MAG: primosomal protein N' [Firmicutes bacterium]|nr:primosomal protein N' [Bacillota bacterium]